MFMIRSKNTGKMTLKISQKSLFFKEIQQFISSKVEELLILCPYIQPLVLDKLLHNCKTKKITIITSWKLQDLLLGSSDLDIYNFCKNNGIYLYINNRVHLKALIKDYKTCIFGSANISGKGLGLVNDYNYELFSVETPISSEERLYFNKILNEALLVDDKVYNFFKDKIKDLEKIPSVKEIDLNEITPDKEFLISSLPMSRDIERLYKIYSGRFKSGTKEEIDCALHDLVLYKIPSGLNKEKFIKSLKKSFFDSRFIAKFLLVIDENGMYFGRVKEWIQKNCTDVPIPSRRDLTGNIQVLYEWIKKLSDGKYKVDRPNYSERIYKIK